MNLLGVVRFFLAILGMHMTHKMSAIGSKFLR